MKFVNDDDDDDDDDNDSVHNSLLHLDSNFQDAITPQNMA